jgi:ATP phosphoribosyltransferase
VTRARTARSPLILALPKGRVHDEAVALFGRAGLDLSVSLGDTRKLTHDTAGLRILVVRSQDVPTYVEHGAADLGIAGRDVLEEDRPDVYEPLDLGLGACRMVVAELQDRPVDERNLVHVRIATKYPQVTRRWLEAGGRFAEVIKLYGSVELAPVVGLADRIVDLVSSGETLRQNGLREVDTIFAVTSRLIVNKASAKLRAAEVDAFIEGLRPLSGGVDFSGSGSVRRPRRHPRP